MSKPDRYPNKKDIKGEESFALRGDKVVCYECAIDQDEWFSNFLWEFCIKKGCAECGDTLHAPYCTCSDISYNDLP